MPDLDPEIAAALDHAIGEGRMQGDPIPDPETLVAGLAERGYVIVKTSEAELYAETRELFNMQWKRSMEAAQLWRAEDPEARRSMIPGLGELLTWLMARPAAGLDAAWLSRVLFEARELLCMYRDMVERASDQTDTWSRRVIAEIEEFRRQQVWPTHGYGTGEKLSGGPGKLGFLPPAGGESHG